MAELRKTGEKGYEVVVNKRTIRQVWSWHGSWSARTAARISDDLKSRKQAPERVEKAHHRRGA